MSTFEIDTITLNNHNLEIQPKGKICVLKNKKWLKLYNKQDVPVLLNIKAQLPRFSNV